MCLSYQCCWIPHLVQRIASMDEFAKLVVEKNMRATVVVVVEVMIAVVVVEEEKNMRVAAVVVVGRWRGCGVEKTEELVGNLPEKYESSSGGGGVVRGGGVVGRWRKQRSS